ncbi:protein THEM6 isoform X2 [Paroedura picta]|uniref:protein THEM6 isoform X2 n=1 Tax=Paroedura picta TaxID=143630 RepID=UPI0040574862
MLLLLSSILCVVFLLSLCLFDIWCFIRIGIFCAYGSLWQKCPDDLFQDVVMPNVVLTSDLDYMLHMNNVRYLREADIARWFFFARFKFFAALRATGSTTVLSGSCSRHRRPLRLFERFDIHTRIVGWDEQAFYLEQRFVSRRKGFVVAIIHCRQHITGIGAAAIMEAIARKKVESPELPEEVKHWLKYNEASSQRLRAESNLPNNAKEK